MAIQDVTLPELGEGIEEADVVAVLVSEGDRIEKEQPLIEVESEKASVEIPAPFAGVVKEILVKAGDRIKVDQRILRLETDAGKEEETKAEPSVGRDRPERARGDEGEEEEDERVAAHDERAGEKRREEEEKSAEPPAPDRRDERQGGVPPAGPGVRRLARELGMDLRRVHGSGRGGRITAEDVKEAARGLISERPVHSEGAESMETSRQAFAVEPAPLPDLSRWGEVRREPLGSLRRMAARTTRISWRLIPHVTQFDRADITELEEQRRALARVSAEEGVKLTVTAIAIKAAAMALRSFPRFNASLDEGHEEIVHRDYVHIGVAVDTERGLVVPVIRDADTKPLKALALELSQLAAKARGKQLKPDEMSGGTFSVTNLGGLGTTYFTPIVTWPQVAVLGLGRAEMKPVFREGNFVPRLILPLAVSYDHRLIDGADAARFLRWIAESLEQPLRLLLEG